MMLTLSSQDGEIDWVFINNRQSICVLEKDPFVGSFFWLIAIDNRQSKGSISNTFLNRSRSEGKLIKIRQITSVVAKESLLISSGDPTLSHLPLGKQSSHLDQL